MSEIVFNSYNIENLNVFALLFQTGYLTITHIDTQEDFAEYTLNYPNFEVNRLLSLICLKVLPKMV
ncbi:hypothetical protein BGP_2463 [Beggiatoa sp. PS]|nr:hypothetical protein BGP_2463 [Beggiatoa sp. PS]